MKAAAFPWRSSNFGCAGASIKVIGLSFGSMLMLAGCATQPGKQIALGGSGYDPKLGVYASPRVVADGEAVPRGGGSYLVGRPYVIGGRSYYPSERPSGYSVVGMASWYGDAFHGRRTANGEVFDKGSISAAHPTLPLPSYVRVTNLNNNRSMIVRVNDRGPYHGGRVMDVSQRVAESLDFRRAGTARIRVEYIGKASLGGADDQKLAATLRTDGGPAELGGFASPTRLADSSQPPAGPPSAPAQPTRVAALTTRDDSTPEEPDLRASQPRGRLSKAPTPPSRPFSIGDLLVPPTRPGSHPSAKMSARPHVAADASRSRSADN
ncbi:septal ring lytic transglycosylase RlpA family protein [Lichenihabitans psoromatis]|uniref:septal ring lytic transglycosylase RlpA family protein n=1 Tax=Lichenihabitans psoromatis TaxID=2528642 RepID=UPI0014792489